MDPKTATDPSDQSLDTPASEVSSGGTTVEEVEEFWRRRMAGKERAWNAAETTLRGQVGSLEQKLTATPGTNGDATDRTTELERELAAERAARAVDQRKLKYPALAATNLGDAVFAAADDAELAKLNVLAEDGNNGTFIAPTAPRKPTPAGVKRPEDLNDEEFEMAFKQAAQNLEEASKT